MTKAAYERQHLTWSSQFQKVVQFMTVKAASVAAGRQAWHWSGS